MATRPVYVPTQRSFHAESFLVDFPWSSGFAVSQKRKNIAALHSAFQRQFPGKKLLEISSKSTETLGVELSAFNLKKDVPSLGVSVPVECIFQGSKVFAAGGPYTDLYTAASKAAKRDERLRTSGRVLGFRFEGEEIPNAPRTAFYVWLYINALLENEELAKQVTEYDGFTDIEFNPDKSLNCQAHAAALFVSLYRKGLLEQCRNFGSFVLLVK